MALMTKSLPFSPQIDRPLTLLASEFLPKNPTTKLSSNLKKSTPYSNRSLSISCSLVKTVRSPCLDRHVARHNKTRFAQKLKTLLLSKPKHYIPLHVLSKCRSYLALSATPKSTLSMIRRYPAIFELFTIPWPPTPLHAAKSFPQLCVRLTPAAEAVAARETRYRASAADTLANKLHKLLMLSSHQRLVLTKLVHLAPDLGLPPNFRSRLCNDYPDKFRTVDTSYGRALELVSWDADLARVLPSPAEARPPGLIVDRPLKFKQLRLRKGLNVKRAHRDFLIKFGEAPGICPYGTQASELARASIEAEKRGVALVREVLAMTVEKRTLIDHLTHFRKDFGLPNKLRGMIVRHPEIFYVSPKGLRDSVMLVEGYDDKGRLLEKDDESLEIKEMFLELVREGKRARRERRRAWSCTTTSVDVDDDVSNDDDDDDDESDVDGLHDDDYVDGFEDAEEYQYERESFELLSYRDNAEFWAAHSADSTEPW